MTTSKKGRSKTSQSSIEQEKPLNLFGLICCYVTAGLLVAAILYTFTGVIADIASWGLNKEITKVKVLASVSILYFAFVLIKGLGGFWRSSERNEIGSGITNFPNPFYDPSYKKGPILLLKEYRDLQRRLRLTSTLVKKSQSALDSLQNTTRGLEAKLRVLLRHNDNANRLLKSYNFLYKENDSQFSYKMLRHVLSECITVLEKDQSDKSISLFRVNDDDKLEIIESVRINAESIAKRVFSKGEGFAGYIWNTGKAEIVNTIDQADHRFNDMGLAATPIGSILGFPLIVDDLIVGVLCLQSESANGFNKEADLRTVEFYARLCTLILLYDKLNKSIDVRG
ncbi:GAF domain-containing protein [Robertmurraya beringensis]|uniref:GAF domain-containing protein n=1 Tax=Robertmurraya beringensis TaxID=641660 RepID=A0ABV6KUB4_9BACI